MEELLEQVSQYKERYNEAYGASIELKVLKEKSKDYENLIPVNAKLKEEIEELQD